MQAIVKNWIQDKNYGFLDNGSGPDILVLKSELIGCHYLKGGAHVEFECHMDKNNLIARKVRLVRKNAENRQKNDTKRNVKRSPFGVMT